MTWKTSKRLIGVIAGCVLSVGWLAARPVHAQDTRGFVTLEVDSEATAHEGWYPIVGLGAARTLPGGRLSLGGFGEIHVWPGLGISGRLGPFAQFNLVNRPGSRVFALAGYGIGMESGSRLGLGVELLPPQSRYGLRLTVQRPLNGDSRSWLVGMGLATR